MVLTQSQQESPTDDGRRRSVRSAGKVGPLGGSTQAAAAAPAGGVHGHAGVGAYASVVMGAGEDARRRGRRARTATDAVASSAR